jgi:acetyl-CoA carboxylase biotin carboxyl carrier protein
VDISEIRKLIRLIQDTDVTEIEVSDGAQTVRLSRQSAAAPAPVAVPQVAHVAGPATPAATATEAPAAPTHNEAHLLKSPMVGTFYRSASPEAESFVSEGKKVKQGETLCIIEAMKLMNEIEAEYDGIVEEVLVENATPVEYGQPLFVIRPL